ncbi:MAG: TIGR03620 family F420-dependent LLM class oxidoreductase [Rhodospirillaceae bacterium]|nr:TIGR03620 family F420-dependent LLM class oxidoreductase [Rhodospirillaceae bacterium]
MNLSKLGVWSSLDSFSAPEAAAFAKRIEAWGYGALWTPESAGRNGLVSSSWLLANTTSLVIATGIVNIYGRDAIAMAAAQLGLNEQSGGRFLLGMGVSHPPLVTGLRGHHYGKPIPAMRSYLEAMAKVTYRAPLPPEKPRTVLAALGPKMLALSGELADGAHPYNVPPEHTAQARKILGPGKLLCVEQKLILQTDPATARAAGRKNLYHYLAYENYTSNWKRLGFNDSDWANQQASDRLIDAVYAWGTEKDLRERIQAHWDAGADHVCIQAVGGDGTVGVVDENILKMLAPHG